MEKNNDLITKSREQKQKENWEKLRNKGFLRFLLKVGFLMFGIPTYIISQIIFYVISFGFTTSGLANRFTGERVLVDVVGILIMSLVFGILTWLWGERNYRKLAQNSNGIV